MCGLKVLNRTSNEWYSIYEKKIPIPTLQKDCIILFDRSEISELTLLMDYKTKDTPLKYSDIKYSLNLN